MMNLIQAMEILNQYRPNRPQSLEKKKLQEAIDTLNLYANDTFDCLKHRCTECKYCSKVIDGIGHPFGSEGIYICSAPDTIGIPVNLAKDFSDMLSCWQFKPKEDNNEKTD